eukprot:gene13946-biopygen4872
MVEALGRVEAGQPLSASGAPTASSRHGDAGRASLSLPNNGGTRWDEGGMREYGIPDPPRHVPATPTKHLQDVDDGTDFLSDQRRRLPRVAYPQAGSRSWLAYPQAGSRSWLAYPQAGSRSWLAYPQAGSRSAYPQASSRSAGPAALSGRRFKVNSIRNQSVGHCSQISPEYRNCVTELALNRGPCAVSADERPAAPRARGRPVRRAGAQVRTGCVPVARTLGVSLASIQSSNRRKRRAAASERPLMEVIYGNPQSDRRQCGIGMPPPSCGREPRDAMDDPIPPALGGRRSAGLCGVA